MNPTCPSCGQYLPTPNPRCTTCHHPRTAHRIVGNGPAHCTSAVAAAGRLANCGCKLRQDQILEVS